MRSKRPISCSYRPWFNRGFGHRLQAGGAERAAVRARPRRDPHTDLERSARVGRTASVRPRAGVPGTKPMRGHNDAQRRIFTGGIGFLLDLDPQRTNLRSSPKHVERPTRAAKGIRSDCKKTG
jgi:hypothetical protein